MKKKFLLSTLALITIGFAANAQNAEMQRATNRPQHDMQQGDSNHDQMGTPEMRAKHASERVSRQLNLDAATTQKVYDAALIHSQQVDAIMKTNAPNKMEALKANKLSYEKNLSAILTPEQMAKLQAANQNHRPEFQRGDAQNGKFNRVEKRPEMSNKVNEISPIDQKPAEHVEKVVPKD